MASEQEPSDTAAHKAAPRPLRGPEVVGGKGPYRIKDPVGPFGGTEGKGANRSLYRKHLPSKITLDNVSRIGYCHRLDRSRGSGIIH